MNRFRLILWIVPFSLITSGAAIAQQKPGGNAALRYWSAFAQMQDSAITAEQAKELSLIVEGTAPYSDLKYRDLVGKNRPALETMIRGTTLPYCDWGIDYGQGHDAPVDYVRKALELGRLNILYAFHLMIAGDKSGAVRALAAGVRFSHDVANGGTLIATLAAQSLLASDLRIMAFAVHVSEPELTVAQKSVLRRAVAQLPPQGLDWQSAMKREFAVLRMPIRTPEGSQELDSESQADLAEIASSYVAMLDNPGLLPDVQQKIASAPPPLPGMIPNASRVLEAKQHLTQSIAQVNSLLN
ncbi:MAG TPA: hypothetical protein VGZ29_02065 [Terriglobia bacterium]|nr:hypothetical protein [Terriglobia bacterium]